MLCGTEMIARLSDAMRVRYLLQKILVTTKIEEVDYNVCWKVITCDIILHLCVVHPDTYMINSQMVNPDIVYYMYMRSCFHLKEIWTKPSPIGHIWVTKQKWVVCPYFLRVEKAFSESYKTSRLQTCKLPFGQYTQRRKLCGWSRQAPTKTFKFAWLSLLI